MLIYKEVIFPQQAIGKSKFFLIIFKYNLSTACSPSSNHYYKETVFLTGKNLKHAKDLTLKVMFLL